MFQASSRDPNMPGPPSSLSRFVVFGACGLALAGGAFGANTGPRLIKRVEPVYPATMSERAEDGYAEVSFVVEANGHPGDVKLKRASNPVFGDAALAAVAVWTYEPATKSGRPVRSSRLTEKFRVSAPWDVKLEPLCGRKVFVELTGPILDEGQVGEALRLIGHWQPASPKWIKADRAADHGVLIAFVISVDGLVVNPEIEASGDADEKFAALYTLMQSKWSPPMHAGEPVNVRVRRTLTMKAGSRDWKLPDPVVRSAALEVAGSGPVMDGTMNRPPIPVSRPEPEFPFELQRRGARGTVEVEFVVSAGGDVVEARIVKSTRAEFDEHVLAAVRRWKFKPALKDGVPTGARMRQSMTFDVHWN